MKQGGEMSFFSPSLEVLASFLEKTILLSLLYDAASFFNQVFIDT